VRLGLVYHQFVESGGLEKYLVGFARTLQERGHELDVVTAKTDSATEALPVVIHSLSRPKLSSMLRLWDFARRSESFCRDHLMTDLNLGFGRTVSQDVHRAGGGCHAVYSRLLPAAKRLSLKNRLELSLERQLYTSGKTRHFVTNASKVRDELQAEYGVDPNRFTVIHTAVDTDRFRPAENEQERQVLRDELGMGKGRKVALFVSSSHRRKGLGALISAVAGSKQLDDLELWIAGEPIDAAHQLKAQGTPGLMRRLRSLGPRDDLASLYRAADFFVHPTLYDACANTVLQSMGSGLPGIISGADGGSEFVSHEVNGLLLGDPTDTQELRAHLETMAGLGLEAAKVMGASARERMLPLSWDAHIDQWEQLFEKLRKEPTS
jgi:UDP-glucose:(heptosyl)LPS alpha-1,3-glucosyltransferase